ncbi:PQQ-dependent sugar dehydrogenase [Croceicoccus bisphenolivorans]|uniref:PQQ-dependent sugar dehydrogenase n=1 Tax=Croceicoccus bisphenolivorans TaxID=1783232 RepID=UPI001FE16C6C|nr:PQQ-dependent sugar dehydrogenase [Croceicoccus bisphenolivorans]
MTETDAATAFVMEAKGKYDEPWAMAFVPGTDVLMITRKNGAVSGLDTATGKAISVGGAPKVDYGGQGGLGDIAFLPAEADGDLATRTIYLSWAEAGRGDTRGAVVGRGTLACKDTTCDIRGLTVIWRQEPKVSGRGHYSHRLAISPDGQYLFVSSGDRQKGTPAQDPQSDLGKIVRLNLDGTPAAGNPLADENVARPEVWTMGHRNVLGLDFDRKGQLWGLEHGPRGGDELNRIVAGSNYGWPVVSNGVNYNGSDIPNHSTRPEFAPPAISWNPVIAPGDLLFLKADLFSNLADKALATGLASRTLVAVEIDAQGKGREVDRYSFDNRLRAMAEAPDGSLWVAEDGPDATLWRLSPRR